MRLIDKYVNHVRLELTRVGKVLQNAIHVTREGLVRMELAVSHVHQEVMATKINVLSVLQGLKWREYVIQMLEEFV